MTSPAHCWLTLLANINCDCGALACSKFTRVTWVWDGGKRGKTFWMSRS